MRPIMKAKNTYVVVFDRTQMLRDENGECIFTKMIGPFDTYELARAWYYLYTSAAPDSLPAAIDVLTTLTLDNG